MVEMIKIKCDVEGCDKELMGYTERQVQYLLKQHKLSKHNFFNVKPKTEEKKEEKKFKIKI